MRVFIVRHGETDWNRRRVMQGHTDIALNEAGLRQARDLAPAVAALPIKTICASPLARARRTAEIVNVNAVPIVTIDALKECGFGIHEGQDSAGAWRAAWMTGGAIEGGEKRADFIARVHGALAEALTHHGPVLIAADGRTKILDVKASRVSRRAIAHDRTRCCKCLTAPRRLAHAGQHHEGTLNHRFGRHIS